MELKDTKVVRAFWDLRQEVAVLCRLHHPNIVTFIGMFVYVGRISSFKHVLLNSKLHMSLATFDETFSSFRMDWRHSTGSWKINEPSVAMDKEQGRDTIQLFSFSDVSS